MLELNIRIGHYWYKRNKAIIQRFNVSKVILGLYGNSYYLNNETRAIAYFTRILSNLNNYTQYK